MNQRMNLWGKGWAYGYTIVLITHFMKGKKIIPKFFHAAFYTYTFHHMYTLAKSMGVLFNLRCKVL